MRVGDHDLVCANHGGCDVTAAALGEAFRSDVLRLARERSIARGDMIAHGGREKVLAEVSQERDRQDAKFGVQDWPNGTSVTLKMLADLQRTKTQRAAEEGKLTWRHILEEEWAEACAESDPELLRTELLQTAAVAVAWIEAIDRAAAGT